MMQIQRINKTHNSKYINIKHGYDITKIELLKQSFTNIDFMLRKSNIKILQLGLGVDSQRAAVKLLRDRQ